MVKTPAGRICACPEAISQRPAPNLRRAKQLYEIALFARIVGPPWRLNLDLGVKQNGAYCFKRGIFDRDAKLQQRGQRFGSRLDTAYLKLKVRHRPPP